MSERLQQIESLLREMLHAVNADDLGQADCLLNRLQPLLGRLDELGRQPAGHETAARLESIQVLWRELTLTLAQRRSEAGDQLRALSGGRKVKSAYGAVDAAPYR